MTRELRAYTVTARRQNQEVVRLGVMAYGPAEAITCAQELYPNHLISSATLHPDWDDEPA